MLSLKLNDDENQSPLIDVKQENNPVNSLQNHTNRLAQRTHGQEEKLFANVKLLGIIFLLILAIFNGIQNILFVVMEQFDMEYLSLTILGIFYISFGLSGLLTPQYSRTFSYRITFAIAIIPMFFYFLSFAYSTGCQSKSNGCNKIIEILFLFVSAVLGGIGCSLLWMTQTIYLTDCSNPYNKTSIFHRFTSITQWSQLVGNVFIGIVLYFSNGKILFELALLIIFTCAILSLKLSNPEKVKLELEVGSELLTTPKSKSNNSSCSTPRSAPRVSNVTIPNMNYFSIRYLLQFLTNTKMRLFYPLFGISAFNVSLFIVYMAQNLHIVLQNEKYIEVILDIEFAFIFLGIGSILAGKVFTPSYVEKDKKKALQMHYRIMTINTILNLIAFTTKSYKVFLCCAFIYGFIEVTSNIITSHLLSYKFMERFEPFTCYRVLFFFFLGCSIILNLILCYIASPLSLILMFVLCLFGCITVSNFFTSRQ